VATLLSAEEPDSFRGHQFDGLWGDEFAKWREPQAALDMALMTLRLGNDPKMLLTTTPRNIPALAALLSSPGVAMTRSTTAENQANLADGFYDFMLARYGMSSLGRQELDGELIADHNGALWQRDWIEKHRVRDVPVLERIVVAVDPPVSATGDECGIVVAGRANDEFYILADLSAGGLGGTRHRGLCRFRGRHDCGRSQPGRRDGARRAGASRRQRAGETGARLARQAGAGRALRRAL
jgi:phage terminase large subunit-like protein